jgi:acetyltransferase-like isoleucine patch superfamily enzyme
MSVVYYFSKILKKLRGSAIKNSQIHRTSKIESGSSIVNVFMDKYSFCGYNCEIFNCEIGSYCSIANNVTIGGAMHPVRWVSMSPVFYEGRDSVKKKFACHKREVDKKTIIEHDVWIGQSVLIKQGVRIGTGAVIGMGSIVTKNVEPYSIVVGNPAKEIKKRFDEVTINKLLLSKWWELNDEEISKYSPYFTNPAKFLQKIENKLS